ncbi:L-galactonate transporter domain protein [Escherichia coli]|nr:L-galactonate transporter domain protein [Escherichia coli]
MGLDPRRSCFSHDCVGGQYPNFASFICASFAPIITGFIVDTTHSFRLALIICGCVTAAGALAYIFLVRQPINDPRKD